MVTKETLHHLVEALPQDALGEANSALERLADPLLRALFLAPEDDEPETEEERAAIAEAREDIAAGRVYPWEEAEARLFPNR